VVEREAGAYLLLPDHLSRAEIKCSQVVDVQVVSILRVWT
jgi:hypothetical protein